MRQFGLPKTICIVFALCAATAIVSSAQTFKTLASFDGTDGATPYAGLVQATDGNFWGTTYNGGTNSTDCTSGCGTAFKITPKGKLITVYTFCSQTNCTDGTLPYAGLVQATDGNFYGTTHTRRQQCLQRRLWHGLQNHARGHADHAAQLRLASTATALTPGWCKPPTGTSTGQRTQAEPTSQRYGLQNHAQRQADHALQLLRSKTNCTDGADPYAGLVQGTDGNFYGTTAEGGAHICRTQAETRSVAARSSKSPPRAS